MTNSENCQSLAGEILKHIYTESNRNSLLVVGSPLRENIARALELYEQIERNNNENNLLSRYDPNNSAVTQKYQNTN